jgi:P27 family predicted phage terminase small subunit
MRGQRKPTALKLIEGEKNKDRINKNEPKPRPISPMVPSHLDPVARREWKRLAPMFGRLGILTEIDGASFAGYCIAHSTLVRINRALKDCGYKMLAEKHTVDGAGNEHLEVKANPLIVQQRLALMAIRGFCTEFGMSPSSRGKISVPGAGEDGAFENLLD